MEEKQLKDSALANTLKFVLGSAAACGAGAVVGTFFRNSNLSGMRGLGAMCKGIGITALGLAAGAAAEEAMENEVDKYANLLEIGMKTAAAITDIREKMNEQEADEESEEEEDDNTEE